MASVSAVSASLAKRRGSGSVLIWGAPLVAILAGIGAEFLDFRALRVLFLVGVGFGVLATSFALFGTRASRRNFALTALVGVATWAGAETLYTILHPLRGEAFHAGVFGPQWSQALGLIAAHGLFLGLPTGVAAAAMLHVPWLRARMRRDAAPAEVG
ncbi:MAG TPA: hypothetical protein VFY79_11980 [Dehalococcoidia bacterium]|jgi:hypothetical protein|nr:hypothetical protein [Dehalococcoidia bacterium]